MRVVLERSAIAYHLPKNTNWFPFLVHHPHLLQCHFIQTKDESFYLQKLPLTLQISSGGGLKNILHESSVIVSSLQLLQVDNINHTRSTYNDG